MLSPMILESNQSSVILLGPAQTEFSRASGLGVFNRSPEEQRHCPDALKVQVGTSVFVQGDILEAQRQDGCDRGLILVCQPDFQFFAQAINEAAKPFIGLWREVVSGPGKHKQAVKIVQQNIGSSRFFGETGAFGPLNSPQDRILVKALADLVQIWAQINHVQLISARRPETGHGSASIKTFMDRANLKVLQRLCFHFRLQTFNEKIQFLRRSEQRFEMIEKWQRHQASARQPTVNTAKYQAVADFSARR